jgi:hypothetical protein
MDAWLVTECLRIIVGNAFLADYSFYRDSRVSGSVRMISKDHLSGLVHTPEISMPPILVFRAFGLGESSRFLDEMLLSCSSGDCR